MGFNLLIASIKQELQPDWLQLIGIRSQLEKDVQMTLFFRQEACSILCSPHDKPLDSNLSCPQKCLQKSVWHEFLTPMDLA